jgi:hypothetical protein
MDLIDNNTNKASDVDPTCQTLAQQGNASIRGRSLTFDLSVQNKSDDILSRNSDNNSRISALESHFSNMPMQFSEAIEEMRRQSAMQTKHQDALHLILSKLFPHDFHKLSSHFFMFVCSHENSSICTDKGKALLGEVLTSILDNSSFSAKQEHDAAPYQRRQMTNEQRKPAKRTAKKSGQPI